MDYKAGIDLDGFIQKAINRMHARRGYGGKVDPEWAEAIANEVWRGVLEGWGDNDKSMPFASNKHKLYLNLKYNVHAFSAFKVHDNMLEMQARLFDENNRLRSKRDFIQAVREVNETHKSQYLEAEYEHAVGSARMAQKWSNYEGRGGMLTYRTVGDGRVRNSHRPLDGVTKPVNDPFWDTFYPPNGWRCRCDVRWSRDASVVEPAETPDMRPMFAVNAGKQGRIFDKRHPYFQQNQGFEDEAKKLFGYKPPVDPDQFIRNLAAYQRLKKDREHRLQFKDKETGGHLWRHDQADSDRLKRNQEAGRMLARSGYAVVIRAKSGGEVRNPDLTVDGQITDVKFPNGGKRGIQNAFAAALDQGIRVVVIDGRQYSSNAALAEAVRLGFRERQEIRTMYLIRDNQVDDVTRDNLREWLNGMQ